jgi:hypothetical protein
MQAFKTGQYRQYWDCRIFFIQNQILAVRIIQTDSTLHDIRW